MRVTGGILRGRKIFCPSGQLVRPTTDKVRYALFQIISSNFFYDLEGLFVVDLFAGTGALGIEALSRGAKRCVFVDNSPVAIRCLKKNLQNLGLISKADVVKKDVYRYLTSKSIDSYSFDLIFCDPPYEKGHLQRLVDLFEKKAFLLSDRGILIIEERKRVDLDEGLLKRLELILVKRYGDTKLFFLRKR